MQETRVQSLSQEDPLEKKIAIHSNILDWKIPWTEEPDGLQSMGLQRVRHNLAWACAHTHTDTHIHTLCNFTVLVLTHFIISFFVFLGNRGILSPHWL